MVSRRSLQWSRLAAAALAFGLLLAGCASQPSAALRIPTTAAAEAAAVPVAAPADALAAAPAPTTIRESSTPPRLALEPCVIGNGLAARCGTLKVYENPAAQTGPQIDIFVAVKPATSEPVEPDPVFFLAGGPGAAASVQWAPSGIFPGLNEHRDIVLMDQRGTGKSHRSDFPTPPITEGMSDAEAAAALTAFYAEALPRLDGDLRYYTTAVAMDDLDLVRRALGYDRINLFGASYGGTSVQYYLRQHGEHVRSAVLDGTTLVDIPLFERLAPNGDRALDLIFARCEADAACSQAFPNVRAEYAALVELARSGGLDILDPLTG